MTTHDPAISAENRNCVTYTALFPQTEVTAKIFINGQGLNPRWSVHSRGNADFEKDERDKLRFLNSSSLIITKLFIHIGSCHIFIPIAMYFSSIDLPSNIRIIAIIKIFISAYIPLPNSKKDTTFYWGKILPNEIVS